MSTSTIATTASRLRAAASLVSELSGGVSAATRLWRVAGRGTLSRPDAGELSGGFVGQPAVMLVHGLASDSSCFQHMEAALRRAGYTVYGVNYSCVGADLAACGRYLAGEAAWLLEETGCERVHVVAHSLGGVVLRWAVGNTAMGQWVEVAVTLGSPHRGTPVARLAPAGMPGFGRVISELRPGRPGRGEGVSGGTGVRWVAVAAQYDWVVPPRYARLPDSENVRNVVVSGGGHLALPRSPQCLDIILDEFRTVDARVPQPFAA